MYFVRKDGRVVRANLSLSGTGGGDEVAQAQRWLENFDDILISAATNPRMEFPAGD